VEIEEALDVELEFPQSPRIAFARLLMRMGALNRSRTMLEEAEELAASAGDERTRGHLLWSLSRLEWLAGRWSRALELAATARELAEQTQDEHTVAFAGLYHALVEADLGLVEEARSSAERGLATACATGDAIFELSNLAVLGRVELALGNLKTAAEQLRELPARRIALGWNDPVDPVWADSIETLLSLGELEQAEVYLGQFERRAERLASAWATESSARCRALVAATAGDIDGALAAFERALHTPGEQVYPFERARTLLGLGIVRRQGQQKRAAREALEQSRQIFEELGARLWAGKAAAELRRISGRQPTPEGLTGTEQRVAELAAQGRSNREIAAQLFMGLSTVEAHLSRVYRKLGIRSRAGLAARLPHTRDNGKAREGGGANLGLLVFRRPGQRHHNDREQTRKAEATAA
jgi:DNA-binding CsgD family transcriptional regulator